MRISLFNIFVPVFAVVAVGLVFYMIMDMSTSHDMMVYHLGNTSFELGKLEQLLRDYEAIIEWKIRQGAF